MVRSAVIAAIVVVIAAAPAFAQSHHSSAEPPRPSRVERIRQSIIRHFTLRPEVRQAIQTERGQAQDGQLASAASAVAANRESIKPLGLRERFALWRSKRSVTRTAYRMADQRSEVGDTVGARDALDGLNTLQASGRGRAEKRAFRNAINVANRTSGQRTWFDRNKVASQEEVGNFELGTENLHFAAELAQKNGALKTSKIDSAANRMVKGGLKMAAREAKAGNAEGAWQLVDKTNAVAGQTGVAFPEPEARRVLVKAFEVNAAAQYKVGAHDEAAKSLSQARELQRGLNESPSRGSRKLAQKLMPRMMQLEAQRAAEAEQQQKQAKQPGADDHATTAAAPQNPILAQNLPDPAIVKVRGKKNGGYYMVGTAGTPGSRDRDGVFTIQQSGDLNGWKPVGDVFAPGQWPKWAKGDFWAPEIHKVGQKFVVYYTARDQSGRLSIGAAWAKDVRGPYTDLGKPLIRDKRTGVIDSNLFVDKKGQAHVVWKLDGNDVGKSTPIYMQKVSPDGMKLEGARHKILTNDQPWEGPLVEAPWVTKHGDYYYMFYSGNMYNTDRYATGVARSRSPYGPYEKAPEPVLHSNSQWAGPGHGTIVRKNGKEFYVYHAWKADKIGDPNPRMVLMDRVRWENGWPKIGSGTPSGTASPP